MPVGSYEFKTGVSAFFEMATPAAREILPSHLEPIEPRHQRSILSVTAFLFEDSVVGSYSELMFSVIVPPMVHKWGEHAKAGFYPFLAATSNAEVRRLKAKKYHFPYIKEDITAQFIESNGRLRVRAFGADEPIVDFSVTQGKWEDTTHILQGYMMNGTERMRATFRLSGEYTMHENEEGTMKLFPHRMTEELLGEDVSAYPFREHWFKNGTEVFEALETF
jgi:hypothetical protein